MKKVYAFFYLAAFFLNYAVCKNVQDVISDEHRKEICKIPYEYKTRFITCIDNRSLLFRTITNVIYECVDEYYGNEGKADSIVLFICENYVQNDQEVLNCLKTKAEDLKRPNNVDDDVREANEAIKYCLYNA